MAIETRGSKDRTLWGLMDDSGVWESLPTFEMKPKKTFFGLDKSGGHCFTLKKSLTDSMTQFFGLKEGNLQQDISLAIGDQHYSAIVRLVRIDRRRPNKLHPLALPEREVVQFDWRSSAGTQEAIRNAFSTSFEQISSGKKNTTQTAMFVHMHDNTFSLVAKSE